MYGLNLNEHLLPGTPLQRLIRPNSKALKEMFLSDAIADICERILQ
jgi:hypothetical protein